MQPEFPYQIVTFLGKEPSPNEPVYYGENGWYPQLALKRRFKLAQMDEQELIQLLTKFFEQFNHLEITTGALVKPDQMPVRVIDITNQDTLKDLHSRIIASLGEKIVSRYPDREGDNYYAHITAEYNHEYVIPIEDYCHKKFTLNNVWLLKDVDNENSQAYSKIK